MRAVLDVNVLVSAVLSRRGVPARLIAAWDRGDFEVVVSAALLVELDRVLAYPKIRSRLPAADAARYAAWVRATADERPDPERTPGDSTADPDDDYLLALARTSGAALVSGDRHLLELADRLPIFSATAWLERIEAPSADPGTPRGPA